MIRKSVWLIMLIFLAITGLQAKDDIEVYHAYGNKHHVIIQGRTLYKRVFDTVQSNDSWLTNLWRRVRQIESNEISDARIIAKLQDQTFRVTGDDEGYFEFNITLDNALKTGYTNIDLMIENNASIQHTLATIIGNEKLVGIISDFDDTLIISDVGDKIELANNTLLKNYKQREMIPGMLEKFQNILLQNPKHVPSTLFILSGSPQQLFTPIEAFLSFHHFPKHTLILKKAHGDHKDPIIDRFAYKIQKIERLIKLYPNIQWIMFGDSGEKDTEVYKAIQKKYPKKVISYFIRNVENGVIRKYN